jgi:hypothetical protein
MKSLSPFNSSRIELVLVLSCAMLGWSPYAEATIAVDVDDPCEQQDTQNALARIKASAPEGVLAVLAEMDSSKKFLCTIHSTFKKTERDRSYKIGMGPIPAIGINYAAQIFFARDVRGHKFADNICEDPDASLVHELWHCYEDYVAEIQGARDSSDDPIFTDFRCIPGIGCLPGKGALPKGEVDAMAFERLFREHVGLCPRYTHGEMAVQLQNGECAAQAIANAAPGATCPAPTPSKCDCCCYLNAAGKRNGVPSACEIDSISRKQCFAYGVKTNSSAGCYASPCSYQDAPACP